MEKSIKGTRTEQNLLKAFAGESQARTRYTYFSSVAKKEGFEQIAAIFLETAELRTKRREAIAMSFWRQNVDQIISSNGFPLLSHAGKVSHAQMELATTALYLDYDQRRKEQEARLADALDEAELQALEATLKQRPKP